jgi:hypothetical protein
MVGELPKPPSPPLQAVPSEHQISELGDILLHSSSDAAQALILAVTVLVSGSPPLLTEQFASSALPFMQVAVAVTSKQHKYCFLPPQQHGMASVELISAQ